MSASEDTLDTMTFTTEMLSTAIDDGSRKDDGSAATKLEKKFIRKSCAGVVEIALMLVTSMLRNRSEEKFVTAELAANTMISVHAVELNVVARDIATFSKVSEDGVLSATADVEREAPSRTISTCEELFAVVVTSSTSIASKRSEL